MIWTNIGFLIDGLENENVIKKIAYPQEIALWKLEVSERNIAIPLSSNFFFVAWAHAWKKHILGGGGIKNLGRNFWKQIIIPDPTVPYFWK